MHLSSYLPAPLPFTTLLLRKGVMEEELHSHRGTQTQDKGGGTIPLGWLRPGGRMLRQLCAPLSTDGHKSQSPGTTGSVPQLDSWKLVTKYKVGFSQVRSSL